MKNLVLELGPNDIIKIGNIVTITRHTKNRKIRIQAPKEVDISRCKKVKEEK